MRFVLEVSTDDDPPQGHLATEPIVKDHIVERRTRKRGDGLTSFLAKNTEPLYDSQKGGVIGGLSGSRHGSRRWTHLLLVTPHARPAKSRSAANAARDQAARRPGAQA
jgi:hypothetical protein